MSNTQQKRFNYLNAKIVFADAHNETVKEIDITNFMSKLSYVKTKMDSNNDFTPSLINSNSSIQDVANAHLTHDERISDIEQCIHFILEEIENIVT